MKISRSESLEFKGQIIDIFEDNNQSLAESEECKSEAYQQGELDDMMYACNIGEYEE